MIQNSFLFDLTKTVIRVRQWMRRMYIRFGVYITLIAKIATAFAILYTINRYFPGRPFMGRNLVVMSASLVAGVLPWGYIAVFASLWLLGQLTAISLEASAVMLVLLLVLAVIRYVMLPGGGVLTALLPLLCLWKIPYAVPLIMGLTGEIPGFIAVGSGLAVYYVTRFLYVSLPYLTDKTSSTLVQRFLFMVNGLLSDRELLYCVISFCLTTLMVYFISRFSVDYAHYIAITVGAVFNPLLLVCCHAFLGVEEQLGGKFWGSLLGLALAIGYDLFVHAMDYRKTEKVQFEDDDYYYYVKAVPKLKDAP